MNRIELFTLRLLSAIAFAGSAVAAPSNVVSVKLNYVAPRVSAGVVETSLKCEKSAKNFEEAFDIIMTDRKINISADGEKWLVEAFSVFGYTTKMPHAGRATLQARRVLELARRDNLVAAKMANDDAAIANSKYKADPFFWDMDRYIRNNTIPNAPEAGHKLNEHEKWLTKASAGIFRAKGVLGPFYEQRPVRFYILGNTYDDGLAVAAAELVICGHKLDKDVVDAAIKVGKSVRTHKASI